jgi:type IV secretory pathway VirB2 component (pilin)
MTTLQESNESPSPTASTTRRCLVGFGSFLAVVAMPVIAQASVEGSLLAVQAKLVGTILPLAAICGLIVAGFSFVAGHPNARQHLSLAIMGAIIGFGAESIVALIRSLIQ